MMQQRQRTVIAAIALSVIGCAVFVPGISGKYFADDFKYVFDSPSDHIFHYFLHSNPHAPFYRPIESMMLALVQTYVGHSTEPIHVLNLIVHILMSVLVYYGTREIVHSELAAWLAGLYMLVSQANALAVLSNDTFSQVAGTFLGFSSLWMYYRYLVTVSGNSAIRRHAIQTYYVGSILFYVLALFLKESSVSFLLSAGLLSIVFPSLQDRKRNIRENVSRLIPYIVFTALFVTLRYLVLSSPVDDRYTMSFGPNVGINIAMTLLSAVVPISSVSLFVAFKSGDLLFVCAIMAITVAFTGIMMIGAMRSRQSLAMVLIALLTLITMFPMALFRHVSELYTYNSMPFIALLFGSSLAAIYEMYGQRTRLKVFSILLLLVLLIGQGLSVRQKALLMKDNGERAAFLLGKIVPLVRDVPDKGTVVLLNPANARPQYSVLLMNDFNVLEYGTNIIRTLSDREDIHIWIATEQELPLLPIPPGSRFITIEANDVVPLHRYYLNE